ncbi:MAG TPA: transcription antitermination factor NusB [Opitutales bacterium]|nr:transcription antitermination factor NusB [Opitutales bacterium]
MKKSLRSRRRNSRIAAVQFLYIWEVNRPDHLESGIRSFFENQPEERDYYSFAEELIHGAIEKIDEVDAKIRELAANWEFNRIAKIDLSILRLAVYEILYRHDIPPIVSINEAIDLCKMLSNLDASRFINGILDKLKDQLDRPLRQASND